MAYFHEYGDHCYVYYAGHEGAKATKFLKDGPNLPSGSARKMRRSARIWKQCNHPNIVPLVRISEGSGEITTTYKWQKYESIIEYLKEHPSADRYQLSAKICDGMAYLHTHNIIHGEMYGGQVRVSSDGTPLVMPHCIYTHMVNDQTYGPKELLVRWAAPEILAKGNNILTFQSDVYSLGMTILEIMTSAVPYDSSASSEVERMVLGRHHPERPIDDICDDEVGDLLWRLLVVCWSYNPEDRPSATEVSRYMNKLASGQISDFMRFTRTTAINDVVGIFTQYGVSDYTNELVHTIPGTPYFTKQSAKLHQVDLLIKGNSPYAGQTQTVIVKCVVNQPSSYKELKRSTREAYFWSKHNHENILPLLGFAVLNDQLAMISPWMEYGSIIEYVNEQLEPDYHGLCIQLSSAIAYLHDNRLIHGDIKGDNLLVSRNGTVKVIDFGVSIMAQLEIEFTETSTGRGSVRYQAPEILTRATDSTREGDVYALGMTMVEIYTHARPYGDKEIGHYQRDAIIRGTLRPGRPMTLPFNARGQFTWKFMEGCWAGKPAARPSSREVYEWLREI